MRNLFALTFLLTFALSTIASESLNWIFENETPGSNILYRPNDFILSERNLSDLVVTGNLGDKVVSPVDGIVTSISYGYMFNLHRQQNFDRPTSKIINDSLYREHLAIEFNKKNNRTIDPKYIHYRISISTKEYGKIHLRGIRNPSEFTTGQRIIKGEILGEIGYCYHAIEQPNLMISRSVDNRNADPMYVFGLKTTFKKPIAFIEKDFYLPIEIQEDFQILKDAILEGYPGLNDYISSDSLLSLYNNLLLKLNTPKTKQEFTQIVQNLINSLRDDHFDVINKNESCYVTPKTEFYFGVQSDSLIVIRCLKEYKDFLGKRILSIDGIDADNLIQTIRSTIPIKADGNNESMINYEMLTVFWSYFEKYYNKQRGDSLLLEFSDGTIFRTAYKMHSIYDYTCFARPRESTQQFTTVMIQDSIAYLDINTFGIYEQTEIDIKQFIDSLNQENIDYLIIDVRNNPGGNEKSLAKIFSFFADSTFKTTIAQKVASNRPLLLAKHTDNLIPDERMFAQYIIKKNDGYYLPDSLIPDYTPDANVNYQGKVFILTNAFSFSAASTFAALFKKYGQGVIIGQETGGSYCHFNALKSANILLPNTNIEILMPLVQVIFDKKENTVNPWGRGVMPDIHIPLTFQEFLSTDDVLLTKALNEIKNYNHDIATEPGKKDKTKLIAIIGLLIIVGIGIGLFRMRRK